MKRCLAVVALAISLPAQAEIYRCDVDGTPTFQDFPCGEEPPKKSLTVLSSPKDPSDEVSVTTRIHRRKAAAITNALTQNTPGMKEHAAKQERINRAIVERRLTQGMSEADARLVYGAPTFIERDSGGCRKLIWRDPDHAARVCINSISHVYY